MCIWWLPITNTMAGKNHSTAHAPLFNHDVFNGMAPVRQRGLEPGPVNRAFTAERKNSRSGAGQGEARIEEV